MGNPFLRDGASSIRPTLVALSVAHCLTGPAALAATIDVNRTDDSALAGSCTLREAIDSFNNGSESGDCVNSGQAFGTNDRITFSVATANVTAGELVVDPYNNSALLIDGGGVTLQGDNTDRILFIDRFNTITINSATIAGGSVGVSNRFGYGGGILVDVGSELTISDSTVSNNTAVRGGGIRLVYAHAYVNNTTVSNNSAAYRGGGIDVRSTTIGLVANNSFIDNNSAARGGGVATHIAPVGNLITLNNTSVSNNTASNGPGGGIWNDRGILLVENGSSINNNYASGYGAGISALQATSTVNDSTVSNNRVINNANGGGGISVDQGDLYIDNSDISDNSASRGGGIFFSQFSAGIGYLTITGSSITNNVVPLGGGGIDVGRYCVVNITDTSISSNTSTQQGAGISAGFSALSIEGSQLNDNVALAAGSPNNRGAALFAQGNGVDEGYFSIYTSTVSGNSGGDGGAIFVTAAPDFTFSESTLANNSGRFGGAISIGGGTNAEFYSSTLSGNTAYFDGGAVRLDGSQLDSYNSTLSGNSATTDGGAISMLNSDLKLVHNTISANVAGTAGVINSGFGGGLHDRVGSPSNIEMRSSIISGNRGNEMTGVNPRLTNEIYARSATFTNSYNLLGENSARNDDAFSYGFTPDATDITATSDGTIPTAIGKILLALGSNGGPTATMALPEGSPAIDAASAAICAAAPINNLDQRSETRPDGVDCDIGAFEGSVVTSSPFVIPLPGGKAVIIDL